MARVLSFLIRYFSNYYTLHRSDLAARAAPLDPRLGQLNISQKTVRNVYRFCFCENYCVHLPVRCLFNLREVFNSPNTFSISRNTEEDDEYSKRNLIKYHMTYPKYHQSCPSLHEILLSFDTIKTIFTQASLTTNKIPAWTHSLR